MSSLLNVHVPSISGEEVISMMFNHFAESDGLAVPDPWCPEGSPSAVCAAGGVSSFITGLPSMAWQWLTGNWLHLVWLAVLGVLAGAACYAGRRWLWRRAVSRGTWLEVVAPRETAVTASTAVWRLLSPLAKQACTGWHVVHPPLTVEVHGDGRGHLSLTVWVPKWVASSVVATEVRRAWPGSQVRAFTPPMAGDAKAAGFRLAVHTTDHEMLVDEVYLRSRLAASVAPQGDPLRAVFDALREQGGPTVLQILAKPAPSKVISRLAQAAKQPVKPRKPLPVKAIGLLGSIAGGAVRFVLDVFTGSTKTGYGQRYGSEYRAPDPLQRLMMRRAAEKLSAGPHLLVAIRAVALRPGKGWALSDASSLSNGYRVAALRLRPRRLWWARSAVSDRFAHKGEWLLVTCSELGVLFHLPADPALFGFTVAATSRPFPHQATRLRPEHATGDEPGWSRGSWSGTTKTALAMRDHNSEDSDGSAEAEFFDPWGTPLSGDPNPHSEYNQFLDDDLDSDWDFPHDNQ